MQWRMFENWQFFMLISEKTQAGDRPVACHPRPNLLPLSSTVGLGQEFHLIKQAVSEI
jgi:hypothetical protein